MNIEKARRMLRWTPQVTLERGLASTAEWFVRSEFAAEVASARRDDRFDVLRPAGPRG